MKKYMFMWEHYSHEISEGIDEYDAFRKLGYPIYKFKHLKEWHIIDSDNGMVSYNEYCSIRIRNADSWV